MTSREFMRRSFGEVSFRERHCSSVYADNDGTIYSYGPHFPLLFMAGGTAWRNTTSYSATTGKHQSWAGSMADHDVELWLEDHHANWHYMAEEQKLTAIERALTRAGSHARAVVSSKKRHDTFIYKDALRRLQDIEQSYRVCHQALEAIKQNQEGITV